MHHHDINYISSLELNSYLEPVKIPLVIAVTKVSIAFAYISYISSININILS